MDNQIEVKVTHRDRTMTVGIFKKGTVITLDLEDMQVYHSGLCWDVEKSGNGYRLPTFETYFDIV